MDDIPRPPLGEPSLSEQQYHEERQREMMAIVSLSSQAPFGSTAYIVVGGFGGVGGVGVRPMRVQVYIYYDATTGLKVALDPVVQCLWNVGRKVEQDKWGHLLNMDKYDDQSISTAVEKHVKSMIDSCPPDFFKETLFEASCKEWMSYLQRMKARAGVGARTGAGA